MPLKSKLLMAHPLLLENSLYPACTRVKMASSLPRLSLKVAGSSLLSTSGPTKTNLAFLREGNLAANRPGLKCIRLDLKRKKADLPRRPPAPPPPCVRPPHAP